MERDVITTRLRTSVLAAILIGFLVWYTEWPSLKIGLILLLFGQLGIAMMLLIRKRTAAAHITTSEDEFLWRLRVFDNCQRLVGFAALGYGFWTATRNVWLALALGILYPAVCAIGLFTRRNRSGRTLR